MEQSSSLDINRQTAADADILDDAVISWTYVDGCVVVLSRFADDVWVAAPIGAYAALPLSARQITFSRYPLHIRPRIKRALYCFFRHPLRSRTTPSFSTVIKREQALRSLIQFIQSRSLTLDRLSELEIKEFVRSKAREFTHLETLTSLIATLRGLSLYFERGYLDFDIRYPFGSRKGAPTVAKAVWREVHGKDFDTSGMQPYADDDLTLIVRNAHFYVDALSPHILEVASGCLDIAQLFPNRRSDRSEEGRCMRAQKKLLATYSWPYADTQIYQWPPTTLEEVMGHMRMCSAACVVSCGFSTGARRGELASLEDDCCTLDEGGGKIIEITRTKGEDSRWGKRVKFPIDDVAARALQVQAAIKFQVSRNMHGFKSGVPYTSHLFVQTGYRHFADPENEAGISDHPYRMEGGRLTASGLGGLLRDFTKRVVPEIEGQISTTRLRKSVARLVTLSMEGAPLVLQIIFGHSTYITTLGYMFASPFIGEEIVESYPELISSNLQTLYQGRADLLGGGAASFHKALDSYGSSRGMQTETEIGMTEEEFVDLGLEMMKNGQMVLNVLGQGMYCLKPLLTRGPCSKDSTVLLPNVGRCRPTCKHHLILGSNKPKLVRQTYWLTQKIENKTTSEPMRRFYGGYRDELLRVLDQSKDG